MIIHRQLLKEFYIISSEFQLGSFCSLYQWYSSNKMNLYLQQSTLNHKITLYAQEFIYCYNFMSEFLRHQFFIWYRDGGSP